ncbi:MAG: hypothetical protein WCD59_13570, partial [Pseudolabrys sp.]
MTFSVIMRLASDLAKAPPAGKRIIRSAMTLCASNPVTAVCIASVAQAFQTFIAFNISSPVTVIANNIYAAPASIASAIPLMRSAAIVAATE